MAKFSNASTLLLASFLFWAGLVMLVAIFGLGARFNPLPVDTRLAKPIPTVKIIQNNPTLEPLSNYLEVGTRPLLMLDRRPGAVQAAPGDNSEVELDVSLGSVLITPSLKMALFRENKNKDGASRRVRLGDLIEGTGWRLVQLEPRRAILEGPSGQRSMDLLVFNGKGGQSPTAVAVAVPQENNNAMQNAVPAAAPEVQTTPANTNAVASTTAPVKQPMTQEQQIEAIRQRITARRSQMQADAAKAASDAKK